MHRQASSYCRLFGWILLDIYGCIANARETAYFGLGASFPWTIQNWLDVYRMAGR